MRFLKNSVLNSKMIVSNKSLILLLPTEPAMPRNPSIIKFFRYSKLSENSRYGIENISRRESLTGNAVTFHSDLFVSTVEYPLSQPNSRQFDENGEKKSILDAIREIIIYLNPN